MGDTGTRTVATYVRQLRDKRYEHAFQRLTQLDTLIIDEVSMIDASFLGKCEAIIGSVRRRDTEPWGGLQVVFVGDFAQLQPVPDRMKRGADGRPIKPQLAFHASRAWLDARVGTYNLVELHRAASDSSYAALLERARFAHLTASDVAALRARVVPARDIDDDAVLLLSRNRDVDAFNEARMDLLDTERHTYTGDMTYTIRPELAEKPTPAAAKTAARKLVRDAMRVPDTLTLAAGARVLLLANIDVANELTNGCSGTIAEFDDETGFPVVEFDRLGQRVIIRPYEWSIDGDTTVHVQYKQVPLMLGWAVSVHRSQGLTLDGVVASLTRTSCFAPGMAYVIMSRVRSIDALALLAFEEAAVYADAEVVEFYDAA